MEHMKKKKYHYDGKIQNCNYIPDATVTCELCVSCKQFSTLECIKLSAFNIRSYFCFINGRISAKPELETCGNGTLVNSKLFSDS